MSPQVDPWNPLRAFVNSDAPDPSLVYVEEREQKRPAYESEKLTAGIS